MKKNIGKKDRIARILFGVAFLAAGAYAKSWFGLIGLIPISTALIGWCPLYVPFKISTCEVKERAEQKDST